MKREEKTCPHCEKTFTNRHPSAVFCFSCIDWGKRHPLAAKASALVMRAIKLGDLPSLGGVLCFDCGAPATDYDHRDYTKPLDVDPVCRSCNCLRGPAHPYLDERKSKGKLAMRLSDYR